MLVKLAWRNIWRNKRRTFITMGSIFFAVILSTLMMSMKEGVYTRMIDSMVGSYTGFVQIHADGYWNEKTLDNSFELNDTLKTTIKKNKLIQGYVNRVESFALAASDSITKGAMVVGIETEKESTYNKLNERISEGEYLSSNDQAILVGSGLAEYLKVGVGDTLVLIGSGYHGASAAGKYPIKGLVKFGSPELSKQLVFLPMKEAQYLYSIEGRYTNTIIHLKDKDDASNIASTLSSEIGTKYEVMDWYQLVPDMKQMIESDRVEGYVFMFILYMVIGFGIFGTLLMMIAERMHEFGVLVAVGMKRIKLATMVWLELFTVSVLGAILGMLGAFPICYYFYLNPISFSNDDEMGKMYEDYGMEPVLQASIDFSIFSTQAITVAILASVIAIYAFISLLKLDSIKAMRS